MKIKTDDVEILDSNNQIVSASPTVTIVNREPNVETISIDQNGQVDPISIDYNNYRDKLNKIYSTTTEENSVISEFVVDNNKCIHTVTVRQLSGNRKVLLSSEFEYNDSFRSSFLPAIIEDYSKYNPIFDSNIIVSESSQVNFIIRTNENDTLYIKNIDVDLASKLNDLISTQNPNLKDSKTLLQEINNKGIGNSLVIILTILLIGMAFIGTIFFSIMSNR